LTKRIFDSKDQNLNPFPYFKKSTFFLSLFIMNIFKRLESSLCLTRDFLISSHCPDGTWNGQIENDPMPTAFFLSVLSNLGRENNEETRQMEIFLASEQGDCGSWAASPEGSSNVDVTVVCVLALKNAGWGGPVLPDTLLRVNFVAMRV
jgi:hypothetical protein